MFDVMSLIGNCQRCFLSIVKKINQHLVYVGGRNQMAKIKQTGQVQKYESEFLELFKELAYSRSSWQVWKDLVTVMACSIGNAADRTPDKLKDGKNSIDRLSKILEVWRFQCRFFVL